MHFLRHRAAAFFADQVFVECQDQFEIMLPQGVLFVVAEGGCEEWLLLLDVREFLFQTVENGRSAAICSKDFVSNLSKYQLIRSYLSRKLR